MSDNDAHPTHLVEVYEAKDGYRWRKWHRNGNMVSESGEAYTREHDAATAAERENPGVQVQRSQDPPTAA